MADTKTQARRTTLKITVEHIDDVFGNAELPDYLGSFTDSPEGVDLSTHTVLETPNSGLAWVSYQKEYRFFVSSDNYIDVEPAERLKYAEQDLERMLRYLSGELSSIGIRAVATFTIPVFGDSTMQQTVDSPGIWGIESDSEASELASVACDEIVELRAMLMGMGIDPSPVNAAVNAALLEHGAASSELYTPATISLLDSPADSPVIFLPEIPAEIPAEKPVERLLELLAEVHDHIMEEFPNGYMQADADAIAEVRDALARVLDNGGAEYLLAALLDPCMIPALEAYAAGKNANAVRCLENARAAIAAALDNGGAE
jgi:hypothetical protein